MKIFMLSNDQEDKLKAWTKEVYALGIEMQKREVKTPTQEFIDSWELGYPYAGAIGGQFVYSFTDTSIGTIVRVKDVITQSEIDLTDYDLF